MLDALARVFSSQGVVLQTTRLVPMAKNQASPTSLQGNSDSLPSLVSGFEATAYRLGSSLTSKLGQNSPQKGSYSAPNGRLDAANTSPIPTISQPAIVQIQSQSQLQTMPKEDVNSQDREQSLLHPCGNGPCQCRAQVPWEKGGG